MIQTIGSTTHYTIQYDDAATFGVSLADYLFQHCEEDFNLMQGWFQGVSIPTRTTVTITPTSDSSTYRAQWFGSNNVFSVTIFVPNNVLPTTTSAVRWLLVAEVTEMFMFVQGKGWYGGKFVNGGNEGTVGEGLSQFLSQQLAQIKGLPLAFTNSFPANNWMTSSRLSEPQTLNFTDPYGPNNSFINCGFYLVFLYYLKDQLGYTINQIIANGPTSTGGITEVYRNLTGNASDPFPAFMNLINTKYPGTTSIPTNMYSPFPLETITGWVQQNGKWYYYVNGIPQTGWIQDGVNWYSLDSTGAWTGLLWYGGSLLLVLW